MTPLDTPDSMDDEFSTVATWTADAVLDLGPDHALPAACRGSGTPASLDWFIDMLGIASGTRFLDCGAGVGGPAEYVARITGATPLLVERAENASRAAVRLFDRAVVVGDGAALPCADGSFDAAWSLGVLCTVRDKSAHLDELARVLTPRGRLGLLVYERTADTLPDPPEGNSFPSRDELNHLISRAGLDIFESALLDDFPPAADDWSAVAERVDAWIEHRHAGDSAWQRAREQQESIGSLIESGLVVGHLVVARPA